MNTKKNMPAAHAHSLRKVAVLLLVGLLTPPLCHLRHHQRTGTAHAFSLNVIIPPSRTASPPRSPLQPSTASTASSFAASSTFNKQLFKCNEKVLHQPGEFHAQTSATRCISQLQVLCHNQVCDMYVNPMIPRIIATSPILA